MCGLNRESNPGPTNEMAIYKSAEWNMMHRTTHANGATNMAMILRHLSNQTVQLNDGCANNRSIVCAAPSIDRADPLIVPNIYNIFGSKHCLN